MKQYDRIKKEIQEVDSPVAMACFISKTEKEAAEWLKNNFPLDVHRIENGETKISFGGMALYMDSEEEMKS